MIKQNTHTHTQGRNIEEGRAKIVNSILSLGEIPKENIDGTVHKVLFRVREKRVKCLEKDFVWGVTMIIHQKEGNTC